MSRQQRVTNRSKLRASQRLMFENLEARRPLAFDLTVVDANTVSNLLNTRSQTVQLGTSAVFYGVDPQNGMALWKSDGTSAGTVMIKAIDLSSSLYDSLSLAAVGSSVYFTAAASVTKLGLWKTDGTAAGTSLVKFLGDKSSSFVAQNMTAAGSTLYFESDGDLWQSNGTPAGTVISSTNDPQIMLAAGNTLYYKTEIGVVEAWVKQTSTTSTPVFSGGARYDQLAHPIEVGGVFYFTARDRPINRLALIQINGASSGSVGYLSTSTSAVVEMENVSGTLFIRVDNVLKKVNSSGELEDVRTDFTFLQELTNVSGKLYFEASTPNSGKELWKSTGTAAGTTVVRDMVLGTGSSNLSGLTNVSGILYFTNSIQGDLTLWKSNGTSVGTIPIKTLGDSLNGSYFANIAGKLFFSLGSDYVDPVLWRSDGTESGTVLVKEVQTFSSNASQLTAVGDKLFHYRAGGG